jgi:hypothetical protein
MVLFNTAMQIRYNILFFICLTATTFAASSIEPGQWELSSNGEVYSLHANAAGIRPILDAIREISPADFRIRAFQDKDITLQTYNVPLDSLLVALGLSFVLLYEQADSESSYQLSKGWISNSESPDNSRSRNPFADTSPPAGKSDAPGQTIPENIRRELEAAKPNEEYRAASPITVKIDGNAGDWPSGIPRQFVSHEFLVAGNAPTNDADASFGLAGAADDDYLYLAIDISDDRRATDKADKLPLAMDDSLEIVIIAGGNPVNAVINRHHVLTARSDGDDTLQTASRQLVSFNNGTKAAIINANDGWKLEVAVPLDSLGNKSEKVTSVGFNVLLHDADKGEDEPSVLSWSSGGSLVSGHTPGNGMLRILKMQ